VSAERATIAHVLTSLAVGGAERLVVGLCASQARLGYRVLVVSLEEPAGGALGAELERRGIAVIRVGKRAGGWDPWLVGRLALRLARERVQLVHTHNPLPLVYGALAGRLCGARVVHTKHGAHPEIPRRLWLRRVGASACHAFVAVSAATAAAALEQSEVSPRKLTVVLNGIEAEGFERSTAARKLVRRAWGVGDQCCVMGTVGRMAAVKNHGLLVRAVAPLLGHQVTLVMAGDGAERARTDALCRELGVGAHVRLLGEVSDVASVLSGLDVFVLSSASEGMPMVLAEAMAASLPVVATAVGGVAEMVEDGVTGWLVPAGDEAAMRGRLELLRSDPARARRFGEQGRVRARQAFSVQRMSDEYRAVYGLGR
jgi:glycosyltransferase involved in cell wall biosynthesis